MVCVLCEEEKGSYRRCTFGTKPKDICADCLGQWRLESFQRTEHRIVLHDSISKSETPPLQEQDEFN